MCPSPAPSLSLSVYLYLNAQFQTKITLFFLPKVMKIALETRRAVNSNEKCKYERRRGGGRFSHQGDVQSIFVSGGWGMNIFPILVGLA